jgi:hypothetical protein
LSLANHITGIKLFQHYIIQTVIEVSTFGAQLRSPVDLARPVVIVVVAVRHFYYWSIHPHTRTIADPFPFPSFQAHSGAANSRNKFTRNVHVEYAA